MNNWPGLIEHYRAYLPVTEKTPVITLNEGGTPLVRAANLERQFGNRWKLYLKYEGLNPTCSFKDRGMTMAVSKAVEAGSQAIICASTGNTSASAAAYAARANIQCLVLLPEGKIAKGKLAQALMYGAKVVAVRGNFDDALRIVLELAQTGKVTLVNSVNPDRIEGQKTASFEICDQLGAPPDYHVLPVGNAGNITAYWKGYREYFEHGKIKRLPKMLGWQAAGAAPIVLGHPVAQPHTIATAIRIGNPASWKSAVQAANDSGGKIDMVTDEEILAAYRLLSGREGIFCEPASAASVAGVIKATAAGVFPEGATIVCTLTGHGLKDPDTAIANTGKETVVDATKEAVLKVSGL